MVIVDNSLVCFANHLRNGIHVPSFFGQKDDTALLEVTELMKSLVQSTNLLEDLEKKVGLEIIYNNYIRKKEPETEHP